MGKYIKKTPPILQRFTAKYIINKITGCWEWQAYKLPDGYGLFRFNGGMGLAHKFSYLTYIGEIPEGKELCHKCDNTCCVSPFHLFSGTHSENMLDARLKGRKPTVSHPSVTSYYYGCRCAECTKLNSDKSRERNLKLKNNPK